MAWIAEWWPVFLVIVATGFLVPELVAVARGKGGSLSVWVRTHLHVKTPSGTVWFLAIWATLAATWGWFLFHIMEWLPWQ